MSLTLKIGSLFIRTLAKPIANSIKRNAREHERFRRLCVNFAQFLHRADIRMRLGLLTDPAVIERQVQRELERAEAKRRAGQAPTVLTEAEMKAREQMTAKEKAELEEKAKTHKPRIRPLSEAKAIDTGANFISEAFMFLVAAGAIGFESWRSRRKESARKEDVADRIQALESKVVQLEEELHATKAKGDARSLIVEQKSGTEPKVSAGNTAEDKKASAQDAPAANPPVEKAAAEKPSSDSSKSPSGSAEPLPDSKSKEQ